MKKLMSLFLCMLMLLGLVSGCGTNGDSKDANAPTGSETQSPASSAPAAQASGEVPASSEVKYKEDIIMGVTGKNTTLDPHEGSGSQHTFHFKMVFDSLLFLDNQTLEIKPRLATEWHTDDSTTYTFKLREDVYFHNGEPVKASDVVWTFQRAKGSTTASSLGSIIEEVKATDDYTVEITLTAKNVDFPYMLTMPTSSIMSEKAVADDPIEGAGVGSGAFKVDSYEFGDYVKVVRNENYWGEVTPTKSVTIRYMPEDTTRLIALETGEIDVCQDPDTLQVSYVDETPGLELQSYIGTGVIYLGFNCSKAPFDNKDFRLAVSYGVDSQELIDVARDGRGERCKSFWGWSSYGYNEGIGTNGESTAFEYNPDLAKEYLNKAYPNGGAKFTISVISGYRKTMAEIIQAQLKKIGIEVEIAEYDTAGFNTIVSNNDHDAVVYGFGINAWADDFKRLFYTGSSNNIANYDSPRANELMDLAVAEEDDTTRKAYYAEVQQILFDDAPYLPIYYQIGAFAVREGVSGIDYNPTSQHDPVNVYMVIE
ncbi:ABC transporter substrate-binding protein [Tyzzerella sp. OttesenSCG-928-J15]|nr:ABC transporter substrate-binding protein [Tyzzerella sp. OttesenSCG-928-J15]